MAHAQPDLVLESLGPDHNVRGLKSGGAHFQALTTFFERDAKRLQACSLTRTYVAREGQAGKIIAYVTLTCSEIRAKDGGALAPDGKPYRYDTYPAVKIARLLVNARKRGNDLGSHLVDFAVGIAKDPISVAIGCRFVIVDAKAASVGFYKKLGFKTLNTEDNKGQPAPLMFLDLHKTGS